MKILITSGGTTEQIDKVRTITNMSTGKLGAEIANTILKNTFDVEVYFLSSNRCEMPDLDNKLKISLNTNCEISLSPSYISANALFISIPKHILPIDHLINNGYELTLLIKDSILFCESFNKSFIFLSLEIILNNLTASVIKKSGKGTARHTKMFSNLINQ